MAEKGNENCWLNNKPDRWNYNCNRINGGKMSDLFWKRTARFLDGREREREWKRDLSSHWQPMAH